MPATINGSPTHVLIVHVVVVLLPLSVLAALGLAFIPASRRAFGLLSVLVAFVGCLAVPLAFLSGSALRRRLSPSPLIDRHVAMAHQLLPVAAGFGVSLAAYVAVDIVRRGRSGRLNQIEQAVVDWQPGLLRHGSALAVKVAARVTAVLLVAMCVLTAVAVVRVGDSGAKAAWSGRLAGNTTAAPARGR